MTELSVFLDDHILSFEEFKNERALIALSDAIPPTIMRMKDTLVAVRFKLFEMDSETENNANLYSVQCKVLRLLCFAVISCISGQNSDLTANK